MGWTRRLGLGSAQAQERTQWLTDQLARPFPLGVGFAQGFGIYQPQPIDSIAAPA